MQHVRLFENFRMGGMAPLMYATCIASDNWSAVGMLSSADEKMIADYERSNPGELSIEKFPIQSDGEFIILSGSGEWKPCKDGDTYDSKNGYVFPILNNGQLFVGHTGAEADFMIMSLSDLMSY